MRLRNALAIVTVCLYALCAVPCAHATVATCTITGQAVNSDGSPDANDIITINPYPTTQIINNTTVTAQPKSVQTDANGNVTAFALIQNLNVYVTFHNSTAAPIATFVPNATSSSFAQFLAGTLINAIPTANGGLNVTGSLVVNQIGTPTAPVVTVNVTGATSYTYFCVAEDFNLNMTIPSAGTTVTTGASTPNNTVTCGGQTGALNYVVLKTNTSTKLGACATLSGTSCGVTDVGQATSGYVPNAVDATGSLYFSNNSPIFEKTTGGAYANLFHLDTSNILQIGGTGIASINFANPTNISSTFTSLTVTGLSGHSSLGMTTAATTDKDELITEIAAQTANPFEVDSSTPTTLFDVEKDGSLDLYGSTSGHAHIVVPAIAGTPAFTLPTANFTGPTTTGATGNVLVDTDGAGTAAWQAGNSVVSGTSFNFNGSVIINGSTPSGAIKPTIAIFKATRNLTVDNCTASWNAMGACGTFPGLAVTDLPATGICNIFATNTDTASTNVTLGTTTINAGDIIVVRVDTAPSGCTASPNLFAIGIAYH